MKVVVTGATGNVGTAVVRRLLASRVEVVGLARRLPDRAAAPDGAARDQASDRARFVAVDLTDDACRPVLRRQLRGADAVVHLAWGFQPSHDPGQLQRLGVDGTRRVLEAAHLEGVPHLVHMSSVGAYSPKVHDSPVDEAYPTRGIATSAYSQHKVAAERILDRHETSSGSDLPAPPRITRLRPAIVGQRAAGSALGRYGLPGLVPGRVVGLLPFLPVDERLFIQMVHADDVADAVVRVLDRRAYGAFNLAASRTLRPPDIAAALGARHVHLPAPVLRAGLDAAWRLRVQPVDPGWLDLGMQVPLLDTRRARDELGWTPAHSADAVLAETLAGLRDSASGPTPVLRPRSVVANLRDRVRLGPISTRDEP